FSQRLGRGIGVLFRLSRESVTRAARAGMTAEEVEAALSRGSRSPLPPNVEHEIKDWIRVVREEES
ncbi:MAG TPA: helicase-associated domain-containing protein, partial [Spirochaetia bacterium]|nr:helicase-associated domain-containing protein [Spirochaetia bacterium]